MSCHCSIPYTWLGDKSLPNVHLVNPVCVHQCPPLSGRPMRPEKKKKRHDLVAFGSSRTPHSRYPTVPMHALNAPPGSGGRHTEGSVEFSFAALGGARGRQHPVLLCGSRVLSASRYRLVLAHQLATFLGWEPSRTQRSRVSLVLGLASDRHYCPMRAYRQKRDSPELLTRIRLYGRQLWEVRIGIGIVTHKAARDGSILVACSFHFLSAYVPGRSPTLL